jgi:16S rRNA (guanine527-N7)-methyltransferase
MHQAHIDKARIAELLHPFLGEASQGIDFTSISIYIDILLRWNSRMNLTAIRSPEEIVQRHFGESLFTAQMLFPRASCARGSSRSAHSSSRGCMPQGTPAAQQRKKQTLADVGSGAGFPGIPIKLWAPELYVTLIESNQRKATFLREITRALTLTDIDIKNSRAETLPQGLFDTVTLRAVERFETILPVAVRLVAPAGRLGLLIGSSQVGQALTLLHDFDAKDPIPIPRAQSRVVLLATKSS